jgi:hypothetical protein
MSLTCQQLKAPQPDRQGAGAEQAQQEWFHRML